MYDFVETAKLSGADGAALVNVSEVPFNAVFRQACEQNTCGKYGTCWCCPPDVGDIHTLIKKAKSYRHALVFQSIGQLEDCFDFDGMEAAAYKHFDITQRLADILRPRLNAPLILGAGPCRFCECCAKITEEPCRVPQKAFASLEAYGIAVSELAAAAELCYVNGQDTVTYFGGVLFNW